MKRILIFFLTPIFSLSIKAQEKVQINLESYEVIEDFNVSDYFQIEDIIVLSGKRKFLISEVDKMVVTNDSYFLMNRFTSPGIWRFSKQGEFLAKYGREGDGPGEFFELKDFSVNPDQNELKVLSQGKFTYFNLSDASFVSESKLTDLSVRFLELQDNYVFFTGDPEFHLSITDKSYKVVKKMFEYHPVTNIRIDNYFPFDYHSSEQLFFLPFQNNIYRLDDQTLEWHLKYEVLFSDPMVLSDIKQPSHIYQEAFDRSFLTNRFVSTKTSCQFTFFHDGQFYWAMHDLKAGVTQVLNKKKCYDDFFGLSRFPIFITSDKDYLYSFISTDEITDPESLIEDYGSKNYDLVLVKYKTK